MLPAKSELQKTLEVKMVLKVLFPAGEKPRGKALFYLNNFNYPINTKNMTTEDVMHLLEEDGWEEEINDGVSRKYKHKVKTGTVTIPILNKEIPAGMIDSIFIAARLKPPF